MFLQGRVIIVWLSWLVGGICGVVILLLIICYCRLMPRHQKSFDEQYLKETYTIKESHTFTSHENYKVKHVETQVHRHTRPASYAGGGGGGGRPPPLPPRHYVSQTSQEDTREHAAHYASSSMLDDLDSTANLDALKTRSLPAFLRPKPRPLSTEDDLTQLYAKAHLSKKYANRMRSSHAACIARSKSRSSALHEPEPDAVLVYDQRTAL